MTQAIPITDSVNSDETVFGSIFTKEDIRIALNDTGIATDEDTITAFLNDHRRAFRNQEKRMCESGMSFLADAVETWENSKSEVKSNKS